MRLGRSSSFYMRKVDGSCGLKTNGNLKKENLSTYKLGLHMGAGSTSTHPQKKRCLFGFYLYIKKCSCKICLFKFIQMIQCDLFIKESLDF